MRALAQRVAAASVEVEGAEIARIGPGLLILLGVAAEDEEADAEYVASKLAHLRIFADAANRFNLSALEAGAEVLVVSQLRCTPTRGGGGGPISAAPRRRNRRGGCTSIPPGCCATPGCGWLPGGFRNICRCGCKTTGR